MAAHAGAGRRARRQQGSPDRRGTRRRRQARGRARRDRPRRERQDPRLPQGQGAAAGAHAAHRQGAPATRRRSTATSAAGSGTPPRRRGIRPVAQPEYDYELPDASGDATGSFTATVAVQPKPELPTGRRSRCPTPSPRSRRSWSTQELEELQATVAELAPVDGPPGAGRRRRSSSTSSMPAATRSATTSSSSAAAGCVAGDRAALVGVSAGETRVGRDSRSATARRSAVEVDGQGDQGEGAAAARRRARARRSASSTRSTSCAPTSSSGIREQLEGEVEAQFRARRRRRARRGGRRRAPAAPLVEARARELLNGLARSVERRGISLEPYLALSGRDRRAARRARCAPRRRSVARELVLEAIADKAEITVSDDERRRSSCASKPRSRARTSRR